VWLDIETTGLKPNLGVILEIGVIITDLELNELGRSNWILPHPRNTTLTLMDDYVLNMHMSNGLLKEVWGVQTSTESNCEFRDRLGKERALKIKTIVQWIQRHTGTTVPKDCYLSGSSVGGFDKLWLEVHAPTILETTSYRVGDVSSFKVFFPGLLTQKAQGPAHRALDDLEYSIDQLRQMRKKLGL
jgi:oligoribonuclease